MRRREAFRRSSASNGHLPVSKTWVECSWNQYEGTRELIGKLEKKNWVSVLRGLRGNWEKEGLTGSAKAHMAGASGGLG